MCVQDPCLPTGEPVAWSQGRAFRLVAVPVVLLTSRSAVSSDPTDRTDFHLRVQRRCFLGACPTPPFIVGCGIEELVEKINATHCYDLASELMSQRASDTMSQRVPCAVTMCGNDCAGATGGGRPLRTPRSAPRSALCAARRSVGSGSSPAGPGRCGTIDAAGVPVDDEEADEDWRSVDGS